LDDRAVASIHSYLSLGPWVSNRQDSGFAGIGCVGQLVATPWLYSARATAENPAGKVAQRAVAVIVWFSMSSLLFFYYISRDWPNDADGILFKRIMFGTTIGFGIIGLVIVRVISRNRRRS
jgi:hypothetical protein